MKRPPFEQKLIDAVAKLQAMPPMERLTTLEVKVEFLLMIIEKMITDLGLVPKEHQSTLVEQLADLGIHLAPENLEPQAKPSQPPDENPTVQTT